VLSSMKDSGTGMREDKALKLQEILEPHREDSIPHGAYVSTRICS
jgi:hypothetical protein